MQRPDYFNPAFLVYFKFMNEELILKLKSNEFDAMWELVADILLKVSGHLDEAEDFNKKFSPYLLCRYLSMKDNLFKYAEFLNVINSNSKLTNSQFYKLAYSLIPKQNNSYIKYIKKREKQKKNNDNDEINNNMTITTSLFDL